MRPGICYVKGRLQPTRALGDLYLKSAEFNANPGRVEAPFNPPYITATPEVVVRRREPGDAFVVIGSDGSKLSPPPVPPHSFRGTLNPLTTPRSTRFHVGCELRVYR